MRKPASREIISASVELWETEVCFLHFQLIGTNVWLPKMQKIPPDVDLESSRSLAKSKSWNNPNVVLCFPCDNTVWIHMYDECKRSNVLNVCRLLSSISWWYEQACLRTVKYQVYQFEPSIRISEQFVSILLTILQKIPFLLLWIDGRQYMELRLCVTVDLFCLQVCNISPRSSLHDLPCHRTMRECLLQISLNKVIFLYLQLTSWIQTYPCNCPQYLCLFWILVECNPEKHGQIMMLVLPNQRFTSVFSTLGQDCVSFQPALSRPHTQTRIVLFSINE